MRALNNDCSNAQETGETNIPHGCLAAIEVPEPEIAEKTLLYTLWCVYKYLSP